jgi:hypothetical protein
MSGTHTQLEDGEDLAEVGSSLAGEETAMSILE